MLSNNLSHLPKTNSVNLLNLHELTTDKIDLAIKTLEDHGIFFEKNEDDDFYQTFGLPCFCLANLINLETRDNQSGLYLLAALLETDINTIKNNPDILKAVYIFLRFRIFGDEYTSRIRPENNCLNDALYCGDLWKDLTTLLIRNGANPDHENGDQLTALSFNICFFNANVKKERLVFFNVSAVEKLIDILGGVFCDKNIDAMPILEAANLYGLFNKYDGFLNFKLVKCRNQGSMFHHAIYTQPESVIEYIINKGGNPDLIDINNMKPLDLAVKRLMGQNGVDLEAINIIARLMIASWNQKNAVVTCEQVVNEIMKLNIAKTDYKYRLGQAIFSKYTFDFNIADFYSSIQQARMALGHNEIIFCLNDEIARGGNGAVFKGKYSVQGKKFPVAIKLNQYLFSDTICHESSIHRHLKHENIIQYICEIERFECKGIVTEYADAGSLDLFVKNNDEPIIRGYFSSIAMQTIAGLKYLQSQGYVHLDVKPGNILLKKEDSFKIRACISDFGTIAKQGEMRSCYVTTWNYISPERCHWNSPFQYENDIFSFGYVLGEMDTRELPWPSANPGQDYIQKELTEGRRAKFNDKPMRPKVAELVQWCWKQKPEERPNYEQIENCIRKGF